MEQPHGRGQSHSVLNITLHYLAGCGSHGAWLQWGMAPTGRGSHGACRCKECLESAIPLSHRRVACTWHSVGPYPSPHQSSPTSCLSNHTSPPPLHACQTTPVLPHFMPVSPHQSSPTSCLSAHTSPPPLHACQPTPVLPHFMPVSPHQSSPTSCPSVY